MSLSFDNSNNLFIKKATPTGPTPAVPSVPAPGGSSPAGSSLSGLLGGLTSGSSPSSSSSSSSSGSGSGNIGQQLKDFLETKEEKEEKKDPMKALTKMTGQQAGSILEYEKDKQSITAELSGIGVNSGDIEYLWSNKNLSPSQVLSLAKIAKSATDSSGLASKFRSWYDLASQVYYNTANEKMAETVAKEGGELQGEDVNRPILQTLLLAAQGQDSSGNLEALNLAFEGKPSDAAKFKSIYGLAKLQKGTPETDALLAFERAKNTLEIENQKTQLAKGLTQMIQLAPIQMEQARLEKYLRFIFEGAMLSPMVRAWKDVVYLVNMGNAIKSQGESMIVGSPSKSGITKLNSSNKMTREAQQANPLKTFADEFVKGWKSLQTKAVQAAIGKLPAPYQQVIKIIQIVHDTFLTLTFNGSKEDNDKIQKIATELQNAYQLISAPTQASTNQNVRLAQEDFFRGTGQVLGYGGSIAGVIATVTNAIAHAATNPTGVLESIRNLVLFLLSMIREFIGSAKVEGLNSAEEKVYNDTITTALKLTGQSEQANKLRAIINKYVEKRGELEHLAENTIAAGNSLNKGQETTSVMGSELQVYTAYQSLVGQLDQAIKACDQYNALIKKSLNAIPSIRNVDSDDKERFTQSLQLDISSKLKVRQDFLILYNKVFGLSKVIHIIQKQNIDIQRYKQIDEEAKGISSILGPGAVSQVLLGKGGVFERVDAIKKLEQEAIDKLVEEVARIKSLNMATSDPNQISQAETQIASLQGQIDERKRKLQSINNWILQQDPLSGEYKSFLDTVQTLANSLGKFRRVYSVDKQADQKNINYEGDYYNNLFEQSEAAPTPYGEAIKYPEKHQDETSKEMQQKWRKV